MTTLIVSLEDFPEYYATTDGQILNQNQELVESLKGEDGYHKVILDGKDVLVHEEIAKIFLKYPNIPNAIICHKNWDRDDNRPENLEWREKEISNGVKCSYRLLCNDIKCIKCYQKSFASSDKVKYWSIKNNLSAREVFKSSNTKYIFSCVCTHQFESTTHHIKEGRWCPYCSNSKLCSYDNCNSCFEKSFASSNKAKYWSNQNKIKPTEVFLQSNRKYKFDCICGHEFESLLSGVTRSQWCPYCSNSKLCSDCKSCFEKSFASSDKVKYWSNQNKLTPREVFKSSNTKYKFDCDCGHQFESILNSIKDGHWCPYCTNQKLCDTKCNYCFNKTFASSNKVIYWSEENTLKPDEVFKYSNKEYKFDWKCGHRQLDSLRNLRKSNNCRKCDSCPSCQLWLTNGNLCMYCKPKSQNKLYQKTKEMDVVKFLKTKLPDKDFIHNKSVSSECTGTHLFPDILFDCNSYNLIVEVDEHKHRGASYACDEKRMYDIIAKLGLPCIFIRYNPDSEASDKNVLLEKVNYYLELDWNEKIWDDYGFKVEYLFY